LAHTDCNVVDVHKRDAIEFHNFSSVDVDISGWFLTNNQGDYFRHQIPDGVVVPANGYYVIDAPKPPGDEGIGCEDDQPGDILLPFSLSAITGEELALVERLSDGTAGRFADRVDFGASANAISFGRWPNATGRLFPQKEQTLGSVNTGPKPPNLNVQSVSYPVIISEVHYDANVNLQFIELYNYRSDQITRTIGEISGEVDFDIIDDTTFVIDGFEAIVFVAFNPAVDLAELQAFRSTYGIGEDVQILGPWTDGGDNIVGHGLDPVSSRVGLSWGDEPLPGEDAPMVVTDELRYNDTADWPATNGQFSLNRKTVESYGNFAVSWEALAPSPGTPPSLFDRAPGDVNENRSFDTFDIDRVLALGKYETGMAATFEQGDWNEDGLFTFDDIVEAFSTNTFGSGPYAAASAAAPAAPLSFAAIAPDSLEDDLFGELSDGESLDDWLAD
ncbi:MAG: lamin tail domain-containing protein, partial [Planctomycetales bacterium]|nr:lamin tail domain-containing protein [Planctomycetales bacterium]